MLAYGASADSLNEYCRLAKSTTLELLLRFIRLVRTCFEAHYLKQSFSCKFGCTCSN